MALLGQLPFGVRYGNPTATTRTMILSSLVNTAMSVLCNGVTYPVTLTAVGADKGSAPAQAGYVGNITISGLVANLSYPYTVTQGANSRAGSIAKFITDTSADYSIFILACDNPLVTDNGLSISGLYPTIKDYVLNGPLPTVGYFHSDDLGYVDGSFVDDVTNGLGVHKSTGLPQTSLKEYDYSIGYLAQLGLMADINTSYDTEFGRDEYRVWVRENLPLMPQWGNHEFDGLMGTMEAGAIAVQTGAVPNAYHKTALGYNGVALVAWNNFFKPLQPDITANSFIRSAGAVNGNHWGINLPNLQIVGLDNITYSSGVASTQAYGPNIIDDALTYLNTTVPFKIPLMNHSIRSLGVNNQGAHYALENYVPTEYKRMFTALGGSPKSIMDNPNTNGNVGVTVTVHGDYHAGQVTQNNQVLAGQATESFYSITGATVDGSAGHGAFGIIGHTYSAAAGEAVTGSTLKYRRTADSVPKAYVVRVDIYGSKSVKEMVINLIAQEGTVWSGRWLARSSNEIFPATWVKPSGIFSKKL